MKIHPTAIVSEQAEVSPDAEIGAFSVLDGDVTVGAHTVIDSHVRIGSRFGRVAIGKHNYIQSGATLGGPPQDWSYGEGQTSLEIGNHNRIGEGASLNLGSQKGGGATRIGDNNFIMAYAHVGHDCRIADEVVLTNLTQLAGHVEIQRGAVLSGLVAVTQFARLGEYSFIAAGAIVNKDIIPYTIAEGRWAAPKATNKVGLKRAGQSADETREIDRAIRLVLRRSLTIDEALEKIRADCESNPRIEHLIRFIGASDRGVARA
ncbi:MAG: acyl-ACP--UDP-N-acetylglucosamine O-acyltransferase [Candidatus Rariloculaceae bacterium]